MLMQKMSRDAPTGAAGGPGAGGASSTAYMQNQPTTCILLSNMYDVTSVDIKANSSFFIEVKDDVMDVCQEMGRVEKIWVEQNNSGNVWVKFHRDHLEGSIKAQHFLNQRMFD